MVWLSRTGWGMMRRDPGPKMRADAGLMRACGPKRATQAKFDFLATGSGIFLSNIYRDI